MHISSTSGMVVGKMESVDSYFTYQTQMSGPPNEVQLVWPKEMRGVNVQGGASDVDPSASRGPCQDVAGNPFG